MVIGIAGLRTSGKDTIGNMLVEAHNFEKRAFADKLKDGICALFDITREELEYMKYDYELPTGGKRNGGFVQLWEADGTLGPYELRSRMSIREILQRFGTEVCRDTYSNDFWLDMCLPLDKFLVAEQDHYPGKNIVVTDMRFDNERHRVKDVGGYTWLVIRPGLTTDGHRSEPEYDSDNFDLVINNDGSLDDLAAKVEWGYDYFKTHYADWDKVKDEYLRRFGA